MRPQTRSGKHLLGEMRAGAGEKTAHLFSQVLAGAASHADLSGGTSRALVNTLGSHRGKQPCCAHAE